MRNSVTLYYPGFELPLGWLKAYLLFHDKVARIIPKDKENFEDDDLKRFCDRFPDLIQDIPSSIDLVDLDVPALNRLDRGFAYIASRIPTSEENTVEIDVEINHEGVSFPGYVWLHRSKVSDVVSELLNKYDLTPKHYQEIGSIYLSADKFMVVKEEAADLILSLLADRVARDNGFDTVTDRPISYSLLALNGLGATRVSGSIPGGHVDKLLANIFITTQVPQELNEVSLDKYDEIRKEFSELHEPLERLVAERLPLQRLEKITNAEILEQLLNEIALEFSETVENIHQKGGLKKYKYWVPFTFLSLVGLAAAYPVSTPIAVTLALVTIGASYADKFFSTPDKNEKDAVRISRQLASLKHQLISREVSEQVSSLL